MSIKNKICGTISKHHFKKGGSFRSAKKHIVCDSHVIKTKKKPHTHEGNRLKSPGFTLIEMLITITMIAILSALAIPSFSRYLKRAHYAEVVQAVAPFKLGVSECFQISGALEGCSSGKNSVPKNITQNAASSLIANIKTKGGVITVTPKNIKGFTPEDTYILTPTDDHSSLHWATSGGGVSAGYAR